jgi:hypothetical protein
MKSIISFSAIASLISLTAASVAFAYIPPATFIIRTMAAKRSGVRSVRVVSQLTAWDSGKPTDHHFKVISVYDPQTQSFRSQAVNASGEELFGFEKNREEIPLIMRVLYDPNSKEIFAALRRADIALGATGEDGAEASSLRRWNGSLAWALGTDPSGKVTSQFWVEKDGFIPVRLIMGEQDIQFNKYRYAQTLAYPRNIVTLNRAGVAQYQEDIQEVHINPALTPEEVSLAKGFTELGNASPERGFIQKYYDGLR